MRLRKILTAIVVILIIITLAFIWGNSLESVEESDAKSQNVLGIVTSILEIFVGTGNATDHLVRKLAHFTEFGTLGCELTVLILLRRRVRIQPVMNCMFVGLSVAVTDEALQLISDRGSQVSDVLLDFCGVVTGIAFVLLIYGMTALIRKRKGIAICR